jgi:hypothetical protein
MMPAGVRSNADGDGLGQTDGVGQLDLAAPCQASGDQVLRDPARGIGGAAIDLGGVLAGEAAAPVPSHASVGIHDDLAARESRIAHRPSDHEAAGGVHVEDGVGVDENGRKGRPQDLIDHLLPQPIVGDVGLVLGGEHHRRDPRRAISVVFDTHL